MMQLARRVSLVVALLLASVGTASAECAWVLWQREISEKPDGVWVPRERLFKRTSLSARHWRRKRIIGTTHRPRRWNRSPVATRSVSPTPSTRAGRRGGEHDARPVPLEYWKEYRAYMGSAKAAAVSTGTDYWPAITASRRGR
jgi:hypothetical protein